MLSEDEWQSKVMSWICEASLIIMYAGKTQWVNWELRKIIEAGRVQRLIFVVPDIRGFRDRSKDIRARMEHVKNAFKNTNWSTSLAILQNSEDIRAMLFDSDGSMVIIKSRPRNRDSYHLGILIAHFMNA